MNKYILAIVILFLSIGNTAIASELNCSSSSQAKTIIGQYLKRVENKKFTDSKLRDLYQDESETGVILTLFKPQIFNGKVLMSSLAFDCHVNLREYLAIPVSRKGEDTTFLLKNWENCVKGLYSGKTPRLAKKILSCRAKN